MTDRLANLVHAVLLTTIALLLGFLSTRHRFDIDLSHTQRSSLGMPSQRLLAALDGPVEIVSWARSQGGLRATIASFVERYERAKPDLSLRFIDPDADPNATRAAGVQIDGELDVHYGGRSERLKVLSERELSSTLLRLSRHRERIVAFLEGAGERRIDGIGNADLGQFGAALRGRGTRMVNLALATTPRIADNVDLLVIANPRVALAPAQVAEVVDYIERGGHLLWLLEADEAVGLDGLADALSLHTLPGVIVDGAGQAFDIGDPSFVAVNRYPEHAITRDFALATLYPQPVALAKRVPAHWEFTPILSSSAQSWNEVGRIPAAGEPEGNVRFDGSDGEIAGPLDFAFALTRPSARADGQEQRVVAIGDGDFLSNSFLGNGGNREFGTRVFDWLLADDALIEIPERVAPDRELNLSQGALGALSAFFLLGLPGLLIVSGLVVWRVRRRR